MLELYPQIKLLHIVLVLASGTVFAIRAGAAVFGARWPYAAWLKWSSATLDTFLLTSAAMLATILPRAMFANGWLAVKLSLLAVYIVLGVMAMRSRKRGARALFYVAALATFTSMLGIARMHHPWGWLAPWLA